MAHSIHQPRFSLSFFHPKYWLIWFGLGLLFTITLLPLPVLRKLAHGNAWLLKKLAKKRVFIAQQNLALCFPDMPAVEQRQLLDKHLVTAGMGLFETAIGWWWPDWRLRRIIEVEGMEHIQSIQAQHKGVLALAIHNVNIETGCRMLGLFHKSVAFYRPHNNPLMDYVQFKGR
ncbi:MAG TPA: lipid A biosynthesis acyltransferase, partial [Glaciecola sp.]|nr:lipid A biosynthesis acyltransferase [Glaciecola sp.]